MKMRETWTQGVFQVPSSHTAKILEVHLPNGEDEDDDEPTVQKNAKKAPKASKEVKGNDMTYKNDHPWKVSITVKNDMNISQFQS
ncbi:hypothetical protein CROQUDRAFT_653503 [Cronartium quercuum f. sp. fusiforme G11]|uniref:Uncharacterized protein n=1 Tax=Cronartium quercuum f. sp. fusiforme G11 TaxID=708437 RepID=A0A9P6NPG1_9BASI|nr:hypothetical protein CROQUDRAFT_653503 [Cronartium quercuum f. sp. fusiforme G11]